MYLGLQKVSSIKYQVPHTCILGIREHKASVAVCDEDSASAAPSLLSGYKTLWVKTELRTKTILNSGPSHSFSLLVTLHTERNCFCNNINIVYQQKCPVFLFLSPYHQYFSYIFVLLSNEDQLFSRMSNLPFTKRWVSVFNETDHPS